MAAAQSVVGIKSPAHCLELRIKENLDEISATRPVDYAETFPPGSE
jgi:hypothetical protein